MYGYDGMGGVHIMGEYGRSLDVYCTIVHGYNVYITIRVKCPEFVESYTICTFLKKFKSNLDLLIQLKIQISFVK